MSFAPRRLMIFGATGAIGTYITEAILAAQQPAWSHVSIFTSARTAAAKAALLGGWKARSGGGGGAVPLSVVVGDVASEADVARAFRDEAPDTVVSALGRGALALQTQLLALAAASASVRWVFPSEYGTDIEYGPASAAEKPHQAKLAVRRFARALTTTGAGAGGRLRVTYLVTGPYFDMWVSARGEPRSGGFDVAARTAYLVDDGQGAIGFTTMPDVGNFLVAALRHPEAAANRALRVQSFVVTPRQVLAEYEKQTGGAPWTVVSTPLADLKALEAQAWREGRPQATGFTLRRIWAEGGTLYDKNDNELVGIGPGDSDSLETAVRRALAGPTV